MTILQGKPETNGNENENTGFDSIGILNGNLDGNLQGVSMNVDA